MKTPIRLSAIRMREWADYYADRWHVHAGDLLSEVYGSETIPMASELRRRLGQLHEIAECLDRILPLGLQRYYWHTPFQEMKAPPASLLAVTPGGYLGTVLDELRLLRDIMDISEGTYKTGLELTNELLKRVLESQAPKVEAGSLQPVISDSSVFTRWDEIWEQWPDSHEAGTIVFQNKANQSRAIEGLRLKGKLLGVRHPGGQKLRYPPCQFDDSKLLPVVEKLISSAQKGSGSGWFQVFWLYSDNSQLGNQKPANLLSTQPTDVLEAAKSSIQPSAYFGW